MKTYNTRFGIEIELTGITRTKAAEVVGSIVNGSNSFLNNGIAVNAEDGRTWKIVYDGSIRTRRKRNGEYEIAGSEYSVELVSPILKFEDIDLIQEIVRALKSAGGYTGKNLQCGIHIHLDGKDHNAKTLRNFINIIASKNDLLYKALDISPERITYCKKMDSELVRKIKTRRVKTEEKLRKIWYEGYGGYSTEHYHQSRYHFLNLHSYFTGNHTVELRGFNSELHAGKVKAYILLALGLNEQALTQKCASSKKPQVENEKFAMRTYLNRIGFIGEEYKNYRKHLCKHLEGTAAWRFGYPEKLKIKKEQPEEINQQINLTERSA